MIKEKTIFIKNIYYMLSYAFKALNQSSYDEIAQESFDNIHNLFSAILCKGISHQLKQGLYRTYTHHVEDHAVLRGRISFNGTIRNMMNRKRRLSCEYDEFSENNQLNQILKVTQTLLLSHAKVDQKYKDELRKNLLFFSSIDLIDPNSIRWTGIQFRRNNKTYQMLIGLSQFIIEGMLLTTDQGEHKLASFMDEQHMHRLYEKFIYEYYRKEFPYIKTSSSQISWALDHGSSALLPAMQSDIMLTVDTQVLIIDAKFWSHTLQKRSDVQTLHSSNLYQIFAYVKNKDADLTGKEHTVSGLLLYAKTDEAVQPDNVYHMSGNKISVKTLDLNCPFANIANQLKAIVIDQFGIAIA